MVTETLHGIDTENGQNIVIEASDAITDRLSFARPGRYLPDWIPTIVDRRFDRKISAFDEYIDDVIEEHRSNDIEDTVCAALIEKLEEGELTEKEVRHNLKGLLIGGNLSPATVLFHTWRMLNEHPGIHEDLIAEYESVVDGNRLSPDDVDELDLIEATIKESMRLFPPIIAINREAREPVTVSGYEFEEGDQLILPQWLMHRDDRFWENAESFDPTRWLESSDRPQFAYFPFGGGPRICPGKRVGLQQMTIALATMIGRVTLECDPHTPMQFKASITLTSRSQIDATVRRR
jgi:cytochrome P450